MLHRLRVSLPDRPGFLARVTHALGDCGADVLQLTVLERLGGRAVDDITVARDRNRPVERLIEAVEAVPGVRVDGCWPTGEAPGSAPELDVLGQVARDPGRAVATLVDGAPTLFAATWAVATRGAHRRQVVHSSWQAPGVPRLPIVSPLRPLGVQLDRVAGEDGPAVHVAAAPLGMSWLTLFVVRTEGPPFHRSELERLGRVVDVVLGVLGPRVGGSARSGKALPGH